MHGRIRKVSLFVLALLQLEACARKYHLPPEDYGIVMTVTTARVADGGPSISMK